MDWADDIAYCVHDVEDAVHGGHLRLERLDDPADRAEVAKVAVERYLTPALDVDADEVADALAALSRGPGGRRRTTDRLRSLAGLKNLTSQLIGRFVGAAEDSTRDGYGGGRLLRYEAELLVPRWARLEMRSAQGRRRGVRDGSRRGAAGVRRASATIVHELADAVLAGAPGTLGPELAPGVRGGRGRCRPVAGRRRRRRGAHRRVGARAARAAGAVTSVRPA